MTTRDRGPLRRVDAQPHGEDSSEPWLAFLLGCVCLARRARAATRPAALLPAEAGSLAQEDAPSAAPGTTPSGSRADAALDALLGIAALAGRFEALVAPTLADAQPTRGSRSGAPVTDLLR